MVIVCDICAQKAIRQTNVDEGKWQDAHTQCFRGPLSKLLQHKNRKVLRFKEEVTIMMEKMAGIYDSKTALNLPVLNILELTKELLND